MLRVTGERGQSGGWELRSNPGGRGLELKSTNKGVQECTSCLFLVSVKIVVAAILLHFGF